MSNIAFTRADRSYMGRWWYQVDRWLLGVSLLLIVLGLLMGISASPSVAERIGAPSYHFVKRHLFFAFPVMIVMLATSMLPQQWMRFFAWLVLVGSIFLVGMTMFYGESIKGARRWISIFGFSLQPSEFVKPAFAIVAAWLFAQPHRLGDRYNKWWLFSFGLFALVVLLIMLQPDLGMSLVISVIWGLQIFLAGLAFKWVLMALLLGSGFLLGAYYFLPHVASRIDRFLTPEGGDQYQITQALKALKEGALWGKGPGEGVIKKHIPDAHADFIFSVTGEEFGYFLCLLIILAYLFIFIRSFYIAKNAHSLFMTLAILGLSTQFILQAFINIASSLHLIPTKGMTLPFISYGGSSMIAVGWAMGMILCLTKKK